MYRIVVIANPAASQFTGGAHRDVMATLDRVAKVEAVWPGSAGEAAEQAHKAAESGADIVVAMGGDGMVHHVAQGLVGTASVLGIVPAGTTNVVAKMLNIEIKPAKAARMLVSGLEPLDLGVVRMTLSRGTTETIHYAIFSCGLGLDAAVVIKADKDPYRKYRFGSIHYLNTALGVALTEFPKRRPHIAVSSAGRESVSTAVLIQFRDVYTYFGRIPIRLAPGTPDPMTVLAIRQLPRRRIPRLVVSAFSGRDLDSIADIEVWDGVSELAITADPPVAAQADGESLGVVDGGSVDWLPASLKVIAPPPATSGS